MIKEYFSSRWKMEFQSTPVETKKGHFNNKASTEKEIIWPSETTGKVHRVRVFEGKYDLKEEVSIKKSSQIIAIILCLPIILAGHIVRFFSKSNREAYRSFKVEILSMQSQALYKREDYINARKLALKALNLDSNNKTSIRVIAKSEIRLNQYVDIDKKYLNYPIDVLEAFDCTEEIENNSADPLNTEQYQILNTMFDLVKDDKENDFLTLIKKLNRKDVAQLIPSLLMKLEENTDGFIKEDKSYIFVHPGKMFVLKALLKCYPELKKHYKPSGESTRVLFLPEGVKEVINYLQKKGSISDVNCLVLENYEELENYLKQSTQNGSEKVVLFLRNCNKKGTIKDHFTPIYIEKKEGKWNVLITDSIVETPNGKGCLKRIHDIFNKKIPSNIQPNFYVYKANRQQDTVNCTVYSLRDAVQFCKHPQIMHYVQDQVKDVVPEDGIHYFTRLPPAFMKVTQGYGKIEAHAKEAEQVEKVIHFNKKKGAENLLANISRYRKEVPVENGTSRVINNYINKRSVKYLGVLISQVISQSSGI